jgi:large conductance mechanosensitive channel
MQGFKKFLLRGNLVDLAVAVVIGAAFGVLIANFVADFVTPLLAAIGGNPDFSSLSFKVNSSTFRYGSFINALITFVIIVAVLYFFVVVPFGRMLERYKPTSSEPIPVKECAHCYSSIPVPASVCAFCTRDV